MTTVSNPEAQKADNVAVDHPRVREYVKNFAKQGFSIEETSKRIGQPPEAIKKWYDEGRAERR